ncbi:MAG: prepilin-type N-terminal cleavage/methylation domain-containing protein [Tatlockia sp.]|nr:prepilin-type N-terminal cleavage/methylation domain-containing protein [Tatlockia sp.]
MIKSQGFSFIEILIALLLITGTSLTLLRQQWALNQSINQKLGDSISLIEKINQQELAR